MPENPTTALVKAAQSPALARVSNQLTLTSKLLEKPGEPFLIPYRKRDGYAADSGGWGFDNYWAFCNEDGQIIFEEFYEAKPFVEGLAIVGDLRYPPEAFYGNDEPCFYYGFLDKSGKLSIPYKFYSSVSSFVEGLSMVIAYDYSGNPGRYGFIDRNGQEVTPCIYYDAFDFSEGFSAVRMDKYFDNGSEDGYIFEGWGFIDVLGNIVVDTDYCQVQSFAENLAAVSDYMYSKKYGNHSNYGNWGYIDARGKIIIPLGYEEARPFCESLAAVKKVTSRPNYDMDPPYSGTVHWGFIDRFSYVVIDFIYDNVKSFSEGLAAVKKGNKWGFINILGVNIIEFIYDDVNSFSENIASAKKEGKWDFINPYGIIMFSHFYDQVLQYSQGRCGVKLNQKWGFIDTKGEIVIPIKYDSIEPFSGKIAKVNVNEKSGYIGRYGREYWDE